MTRDNRDRIDVGSGADTDHDGHPDTVVVADRPELTLAVDANHDSFADLLIEIGPDAVAHWSPLWPTVTDPLAPACFADDLSGIASW